MSVGLRPPLSCFMSTVDTILTNMGFKEKYWKTLIIMQDPDDKVRMQLIGNQINLTPAKILGKLVSNFIKKYEDTNGRLV